MMLFPTWRGLPGTFCSSAIGRLQLETLLPEKSYSFFELLRGVRCRRSARGTRGLNRKLKYTRSSFCSIRSVVAFA
jgi:hypothetical protein